MCCDTAIPPNRPFRPRPADDEEAEAHDGPGFRHEVQEGLAGGLEHALQRVAQHGCLDVNGLRELAYHVLQLAKEFAARQLEGPVGLVVVTHTAEVVYRLGHVAGLIELEFPCSVERCPRGVVVAHGPVVVDVDTDEEVLSPGRCL